MEQPKKNDTKILVIIIAVILGAFVLFVAAIYFISRFIFGMVFDVAGVPPDDVFVSYLSEKYEGDTFVNTGNTGGSGCSYFELGFCDKIYHSAKYDRDFVVVYHRGDPGYFTDKYWLAQHSDDLDAYYAGLFNGIFDYKYSLEYVSYYGELDDIKVDLTTEELMKDDRFRITVDIVVTEKDAENATLDFMAMESAVANLKESLPGVEKVEYVVKSEDGRYPEICKVVDPAVKSSSSDHCSRTLLRNSGGNYGE